MSEISVLEKTRISTTTNSKKTRVIMHNDDTTSFEVVIFILCNVFKKTESEAFMIALSIHNSGPNGKKVIAEYPKSIALAKVNKALQIAKDEGYPNFKITTLD